MTKKLQNKISVSPRSSKRGGGEVTIAEVAVRAGVSPMTVSRVLNGGENVRDATKARVDEAIADLNYVPNAAARSLAGGRNCRIALLHSNPSAAYLSALLVGALDACSRLDAQLVVEPLDEGVDPQTMVARLAKRRIDAVLLPAPLCDDAALRGALLKAGLPVAQMATARPDTACFAVSISDTDAAQAMTAHLIARGHTRIGFITGSTNQTASARRQDGYAKALTGAGLAVESDLVVAGDFTYASGLRAAAALLDRSDRPSAIFASNDDMAAAAVAVAHRMGLSVPMDVAICGFDDTVLATCIWPELTTIRQPVKQMAAVAVEALFRAVDDVRKGEKSLIAQVQLSFELIERASA